MSPEVAVWRGFAGVTATPTRVGTAVGVCGMVLALGAVLGLVAGSADPTRAIVDLVGLSALVPFVSIMSGCAVVGEPRADGRLATWWARPIGRGSLAVAAQSAAAMIAVPVAAVGTVLCVLASGGSGRAVVAAGVAVGLVAWAMCSVAVLVGSVSTHAIGWVVGYAAIVDQFVARSGRPLAWLSLRAHGLAVYDGIRGVDASMFSVPVSIVAVSMVALGSLAGTAIALGRIDLA